MAQLVGALAVQTPCSELDPGNPCKGRREVTSQSCVLSSPWTDTLYKHVCNCNK